MYDDVVIGIKRGKKWCYLNFDVVQCCVWVSNL